MLKVVILFDSPIINTIFAYKYKIYHLNDQDYLEENI